MARFIISAFADEYNNDIDVQLRALKENGITAIEPRNVSGTNISSLSDEQLSSLAQKLKAADIKVSSLGSPLGKIKIDDPMDEHLKLTERCCQIANALGCDKIRIFSFYLPKDKKAELRSEVIARLSAMLDIADKYKVRLCHENEAGIYGESPEMCSDLLEHFDGRLGCVFDMGNFALDAYETISAYELLKNRIDYFHIKDGTAKKEIVPTGLGEGNIAQILSDYSKSFDKTLYVTLEPHLLTFDGLKALTDKTFSYPYPFKTSEEAFVDALGRLRKIIG